MFLTLPRPFTNLTKCAESLEVWAIYVHALSDRFGLAITSLPAGTIAVKALALATAPGGRAVRATRASVQSGKYPLRRTGYAYVNCPAGRSADPLVAQFLRYVLSKQGQGLIGEHDGYLALPAAVVQEQLTRLQ